MPYSIEFTSAARRDLKRLPKHAQERIDKVLQLLCENPRPPKVEYLKGKLREYNRVRTGDYRIIYLIEDDRLVVCVVSIGHRKDVYRKR